MSRAEPPDHSSQEVFEGSTGHLGRESLHDGSHEGPHVDSRLVFDARAKEAAHNGTDPLEGLAVVVVPCEEDHGGVVGGDVSGERICTSLEGTILPSIV